MAVLMRADENFLFIDRNILKICEGSHHEDLQYYKYRQEGVHTYPKYLYDLFLCPYSRAQGDINHQLMVGGKRETGRIL